VFRAPCRSIALTVLVVAVSATHAAAADPSASPMTGSPQVAPTALVVGLGYIPSVQFAQFYYADARGYYRDAGLNVTFQHQIDPQLIVLIGQGAVDIGLGDGTSVIPAASQEVPIRYAATIYAQFPSIVFAKASKGIATPADLAGRTIGTPGQFGSSWVMLQAMLASAGLTPGDVTITLFPDFTQAIAVAQDQVDAATGFVNNEPVQLELQGTDVNVLHVDDLVPLPGPGLVVGESTLAAKRDALAAFVEATLRAMSEISADPTLGLEAAFVRVPELATQPEAQRAILDATIATWSSPYTDQNGSGAIDPEAWQASIDFLASLGQLGGPVTVNQVITQELLPER
jgi:NitT/TauT family transport system substrate-binding protein